MGKKTARLASLATLITAGALGVSGTRVQAASLGVSTVSGGPNQAVTISVTVATPTLRVTATATPTKTETPVPPTRKPPTPSGPALIVGSVAGNAGDQVTIDATLSTAGLAIAGTQNDITFDAVNAPIAAKPNGKPDCTVNPNIDKGATSFTFLPPGCSGSGCTSVRALVLALDNADPIADGSVLYTCTVNIAANAPNGTFPLRVRGVLVGGGPLVVPTGVDGAVVVGPPLPAPQAEKRGGGGCQVGPAGSGAAVWLLLPLAALLVMRRRRRAVSGQHVSGVPGEHAAREGVDWEDR